MLKTFFESCFQPKLDADSGERGTKVLLSFMRKAVFCMHPGSILETAVMLMVHLDHQSTFEILQVLILAASKGFTKLKRKTTVTGA